MRSIALQFASAFSASVGIVALSVALLTVSTTSAIADDPAGPTANCALCTNGGQQGEKCGTSNNCAPGKVCTSCVCNDPDTGTCI